MKRLYIFGALFLVVMIGFGIKFIISEKTSIVPSVSVQDQTFVEGSVIIQEVVFSKPGWLVIQTNDNGIPGPVIGYTKINAGNNKDVKVKIDKTQATETLYAMIHEDNGVKDKFDFPTNDLPLMYNMKMVAQIFKLD